MGTFVYSDAGLAMTKGFEGLRLEAYQDVEGVWTVGYGHIGAEVRAGMRVTGAEASELLRGDLAAAVACVNRAVEGCGGIAQEQFDALVDFCFNVGRGSFLGSSLLRYMRAGETEKAADEFLFWVNAGGKRCAGLVRRRVAERSMFLGASG